jgi:plasmid stability protein
MRTTIDLPDPLFREMKIRAAQQGLKLKDLAASYIEAGLRGTAAPASTAPRRRAPLPAAILRDPEKPLIPALSNRELDAILEQEDQESLRQALLSPPHQP